MSLHSDPEPSVLQADQFDKLILTLGSEPSFSLWSGMFWVSVGTVLVGLAAITLTVLEARRSRRGADAELILSSFEKYEKLYASLRAIPELAEENRALLDSIPDTIQFNSDYFDVIENYEKIDMEKWGIARETKIYFKSRFELHGKKFFSDQAIAITMDHAGVNLVRDQLRKLDLVLFYQVRRERYRKGEFSEGYLARSFNNDLTWYDKLPAFMRKHGTAFGWDT